MISLFIDSSDKKIIISLYKELTVIETIIEDANNDISKKLLVFIDELLSKNNISVKEIEKIFVVIGPGSFTGTRIGVDIAKVMSYSLNIKVVPISELELLSTTNTKTDYVLSYIDARRNYIYAGMYDHNLKPIINDEYISLEKLNNKIKRHTSFDRVSYVSYYSLIDNTIKPDIDVDKIIKKHINDEGINPHLLVPNYLKKTEAEEKLLKND